MYKKIISAILAIVVVFGNFCVFANAMSYKPYVNKKFCYNAIYPSGFTIAKNSVSKDGIAFSGKNGEILLYSGFNLSKNMTGKSMYQRMTKTYKNINYKQFKSNQFEVGWTQGAYGYFTKVCYGKGSVTEMTFVYPKKMDKEYKTTIKQMSAKFTASGTSKRH